MLIAMKRAFFLIVLFVSSASLFGQRLGIKSNLLYDVTTTLNAGVEFGLSPQWTLDVSGNYNPFSYSDYKKWKHWMVQPEARYWFCERFNGHFVGAHLLGGQFNVGNVKFPLGLYPSTRKYRYEGYYYGAGLVYGYQWILHNRWSIEAALGVGYVQSHYDKYDCPACGEWREKDKKGYFSVTKVAVSLIYMIK